MLEIRKRLSNALRKGADSLDAGNTPLEEEDLEFLLDAVRYLTEEKLSKYQVAQRLNLDNTKKVDYLVATGRLRKGRKQTGFKEIFWYPKDLENIPKSK